MVKETGIITIYQGFIEYLKKEKERIATIILTGECEDYLVKEFSYYVYKKYKGQFYFGADIFAIIKNKRRWIDLVLYKGLKKDPTIIGLIEAKHIRSAHKIWPCDDSDFGTKLEQLSKQIGVIAKRKTLGEGEAKAKLSLTSENRYIYGLLFAPYVKISGEKQRPEAGFYNLIEKNGKEKKLKNYNSESFKMTKVFENVKINYLKKEHIVNLRMALLRK